MTSLNKAKTADGGHIVFCNNAIISVLDKYICTQFRTKM